MYKLIMNFYALLVAARVTIPVCMQARGTHDALLAAVYSLSVIAYISQSISQILLEKPKWTHF